MQSENITEKSQDIDWSGPQVFPKSSRMLLTSALLFALSSVGIKVKKAV